MTRSIRPVLLATGLATFFLAGSLAAEPPRMLGDFATGSAEYSLQAHGFQDVGGITVYAASDPSGFHPALWRSDGTAAGTWVLRILIPGGGARAAGTANGRAYYSSLESSDSGNLVSRLWVTDGTREGSTLLTPQPIAGWGPAAAGGYGLFFTACERSGACSFWSSDGTAEGTARRGAIQPDTQPGIQPDASEVEPLQLVALERIGLQLLRRGERVDLLAIDPAGGVEVLRRFRAPDRPRLLTAAGDRAFFLAPVGGQLQLWTSDGTRNGTRALTGFTGSRPFYSTTFLRFIGGSVYFLADDGRHGVELWAHDGGRGSGRRLTDFAPPEPFEYLYLTDGDPGTMLGRIGDVIVFSANGGDGWRIWTTRGTPASTQPLRGCPAGCPETSEGYTSSTYFVRAGRRLVFAASDPQHGRELWTTDGTGPGTVLVSDLTPGPDSLRLRIFTPAGRHVVFQNFTDEYDTQNAELWVTDGTAAGTHRLAHGGPGDSHYVRSPNPRLDVGAPRSRVVVEGFEHDGREGLWASDGTAAGTGQIRAGRFPAGSAGGADFVWFGDRLLARLTLASDSELVALGAGGAGAPEPLVRRPDSSPVLIGGRAVVAAYPDTSVYEIWGTDGTPAGTQQLLTKPHLAPVNPSPSPRWGALFLAFPQADDGGFNLGEPVTLYQTDGTPAGTRPLLELPSGMIPYSPVEIGGRIYFHAYEYGREGFRVWTSDGTLGGTVPLFAGSTDGYHPPQFTGFGGEVVFLALGADGAVGLWRTAGTPETTRRIARLVDYELWNGGQGWSFEVAAGKIYFWAPASPDVIGPLHPWVSAGTAAGTRQLAEVIRDVPSYIYIPGDTREFVAAGTKVFFAAADGVHGTELWSTDGTPGGTALAADLWPGPFGSDPRQLTALGDELAFVAQTLHAGAELRLFTPCTGTLQVVADLAPGPSWSEPLDLLWDPSHAVLVFSANDGFHGYEPWEWRPGDTLGACSPSTSAP